MPEKLISLQKNIVDFILEPEFTGVLLLIKTIFIIFSLLLTGAIALLFLRASWFKWFFWQDFIETFTKRPYGAKQSFKEWTKIQKRCESGKEDDYKLALIEADALLENVFKTMGYKGESMADYLNQLDSSVLPGIDQVREAHQMRNNIVHDPDYKLNPEIGRKTFGVYEQAFRDLEVF